MVALLGIAGSEAAIFYGRIEYALWGHLLTLLVCVLVPLRFEEGRSVLQVLTLVPAFRLVNLGMPVFTGFTLYWLPLVYGPFIPAAYLVARSRSVAVPLLGRKRTLLLLPFALPVSAALGIVEYAIVRPEPLIPVWNGPMLVWICVVMFAFVAVVEELLYRGIIQRVFEDRIGRWTGLLFASLLFGLMHSGYGLPRELLFATAIGFLFGVVYDYTRSLLLVIVMHGTLDLFLFAVVPFHPWLVGYLSKYFPNRVLGAVPV